MTSALLTPSVRLARSAYPEREDRPIGRADLAALGLFTRGHALLPRGPAREVARLARVMPDRQRALAGLADTDLVSQLRRCGQAAVRSGTGSALEEALMLVAQLCTRAMGLTPYPAQLAGAAALIRGRLAEMATGEGKTLTAGLAACVAASAGVPVHVVTVNDYLAKRDATTLKPLFERAGLRVAFAVHGMSAPDKRDAYGSDVTYCTGKELVFDYLRDRVDSRGRSSAAQLRARQLFGEASAAPVLRGLHFAIVDEADSILIDEARTPLILAEKAGAVEYAQQMSGALEWAERLVPDIDFRLDERRREIVLTRAGLAHLETMVGECSDPVWQVAHVREHLLTQALRARHLYCRDHHYLVDGEGKVQIIDEYTGRVLEGRTWELGLHQMIECKEGLALSERTQTLARITFQRFFCRYLRLAGMTGTAREMARELSIVYRLRLSVIPLHRPGARRRLGDRVYANRQLKWQAVVDEVMARHARGQPVLVGTRSVQASEVLSRLLTAQGITHRVLNARQDADEAAVVALAGQLGAVTVATNMAGRGTDIELGEGVAERGGLCVVLTEYHESPRIDRQLFGRCARQGQPGVALGIVSLDDDIFRQHAPGMARFMSVWPRAAGWLLALARRSAQSGAERMHARTRRDTLRHDWQLEQSMGFSGDPI